MAIDRDVACYWCGEPLTPLRVIWQPSAVGQPVLQLHEDCVRPLVQALARTVMRASVCVVCAEPIQSLRSTKRYCSERCKARVRRGGEQISVVA